MAFDSETAQLLAQELQQAEENRAPIDQFSQRFPGMSIDDGYRVGRAWVELKKRAGQKVFGHKIGLTSRAMQEAAAISEPDYGTLLDDMVFDQGGDIPSSRFIVPRVEAELAFFLKRDLAGPGVSIFEVLAATEYVVPALEIIDSRIVMIGPTGSRRQIQDTIADNAANAGIVIGGDPMRPDALDLRWAGTMLAKNGVIEETGLAAGVLNHPAIGIAWLANRLARWDQKLEAGQIVLAGSFVRPVPIASNDVVHADYGRLGSISFRMV